MAGRAKAPFVLTTPRLILRKPELSDAEAVFSRYASDRDALRYMGWPAHESPDDTRKFLEFSNAEWVKWPAGPYLILSGTDRSVLGSTGFAFEAPDRASTGYVLARDAWGRGYATEALRAIVDVARALDLARLRALCHAAHRPSAHVLEKAGFALESRLEAHQIFPNLGPAPQDVLLYVIEWRRGDSP